ncbi:MAG: hypothetical protein NT143_02160 [Actinobacteria bacterium]|nr:hypothetical protein [Actinomycetota bacterium]
MFKYFARHGRLATLSVAMAAIALPSFAVSSSATAAAWTGPGTGTAYQLEPGLDVVAIPNNGNPLDRTTPNNLVTNGDFTANGFGNTAAKKWGPASTNNSFMSGLWISNVFSGIAGVTGTGTNGLPFRSMPGWTFTGGGSNTYALWLPGTSAAVGPWSNGLSQWGPYGSKNGASNPQIYFGNDEGWSISPTMATLRSTSAFTQDVTQTALTFTPSGGSSVSKNYVSSSAPTVFQEVPTTVGDTYCLSYWVGHETFSYSASNPGSDARSGIARVRIGTSTGASGNGYSSVFFKVPTLVGSLGERWYTFQFVAKASSTRIAFTSWGHLGSGTTNSTELVLDDVVVEHCAAAPVAPPPAPSVGVGDKVWIDANANGIQDGSEAPLAGVQVQLLSPDGTIADDENGNPVAPVTTDSLGAYFISGLAPGNYKVQFTLPSGYVFTTPTASAGTSGTDSNPSPTTSAQVGVTPLFTVEASATGDTTSVSRSGATLANLTIDAGVVRPVGMGNYTWVDSNSNGIQDVGEAPLPGVVVELLTASGQPATDAAGNPVASVTTDSLGAYFIGNLLPGTYTARFTLPSGYTFTTPGAGSAATDSNPVVSADPLVGVTPAFIIAPDASGDTTAVTGISDAAFANLTIAAGVVSTSESLPSPSPSPDPTPDPTPAPGSGTTPSGSSGESGTTPSGSSGGSGSEAAAASTGTPRRPVVTASVLKPSVGVISPSEPGGATSVTVVIANPTDTTADGVRTSVDIPDGVVVVADGGGVVNAGRLVWPARRIPAHGRLINTAKFRSAGRGCAARLAITVSAGGRRVSISKHVCIATARRGGGSAVTG